jgi:glycine hydroxymethyltransferase
LEHIIAAKAVSFKEAMEPAFKTYQKQVIANAKSLAAHLTKNGIRLVSGGTDNHLMLLDLSATEITGKQLEEALGRVEITVNKNTVPKEKRSPFVTSGVRIGTPAITSRGLGPNDMETLGDLIASVVKNIDNQAELDKIRRGVLALADRFPLYPEWSV